MNNDKQGTAIAATQEHFELALLDEAPSSFSLARQLANNSTIQQIVRESDDIIATINAIPATPLFNGNLTRLAQLIKETRGTMATLIGDLHRNLISTTTALILDIPTMDENMSQLKDKMTMDSTHLTEAISTLSANIACLSGETTALSVCVTKHQGHLENLLGFKVACQAQMDDHWHKMTKLKTLVNKVKSTTATQTQCSTAQLDGLHSNSKIAHCENIHSWISLSDDLVLSHQQEIYGFKFPKRFLEISSRDLTSFLLQLI